MCSIKFPKCKLGAIIGALNKPGAIIINGAFDKLITIVGAIIEALHKPGAYSV